MKKSLVALLLITQIAAAQRLKKSERLTLDRLRSEITYLSSDSLQGRNTGSEGEKLAYEYLTAQFKDLGLLPKGDHQTYIQSFEIKEGKQVLPSTRLSFNDQPLQEGTDFFPLAYSAAGGTEGYAAPVLQEKGVPWFWNLKDLLESNAHQPDFDLKKALLDKVHDFAGKGASAVIIYNTSRLDDGLQFDPKDPTETLPVPVVYVTRSAAEKYFRDRSATYDISVKVAFGPKLRIGHNVIGYIDNGAPTTIILGAHYDHLGHGEDHNGLWTGPPAIFHGADDNASGTAAVIELARMLKESRLKDHNYLFICFSGEELGLLGSKYFAAHPTIDLSSVDYMINSDMIGRLNDTTHLLTIGGYGTSPEWSRVVESRTRYLNIKFDSSGVGPSDQTSFYMKDIPVLFFFTGIHPDYHKPTDVVSRINFPGELRVIQYMIQVIEKTNRMDKLAFSKTREPRMEGAHFTVTLGIMPDYSFSGKGVRADGIIEGKIAQKAGIRAGDVLIRLGSHDFSDIYAYMDVLSKFKKGDATTVTVMRGKQELTFPITF
ncbi:MAG: M20/M25/M40 family metallo-hydrolase [Bacteroidota bacterium]|nr:M20/M25/M40 family metallo-hydrolase [Bacteroidota bacterium]